MHSVGPTESFPVSDGLYNLLDWESVPNADYSRGSFHASNDQRYNVGNYEPTFDKTYKNVRAGQMGTNEPQTTNMWLKGNANAFMQQNACYHLRFFLGFLCFLLDSFHSLRLGWSLFLFSTVLPPFSVNIHCATIVLFP